MLITPEFLKQKAREISYALNKVSFYIKRADLRNRLERLSFDLLENAAVLSQDASDKAALTSAYKNLSALDVLIRLGHSLYEIEPVNATILIREIDSFNSAIRQFGNSAIRSRSISEDPRYSEAISGQFGNSETAEEVNLETIFSKPPAIIDNKQEKDGVVAGSAVPKNKVEQMINSTKLFHGDLTSLSQVNSANALQSGSATVRQSLIAEKIRQYGKINVRDLMVQFPGVSERTLRYDLQRLCDRQVLEKIGNSGPGTGYIIKNNGGMNTMS